MLLPPGAPLDDHVPAGPSSVVVPSPNNRLAALNSDLGKLIWEQWGVARQARKHQAGLLHTPYLTAPLFGVRDRRKTKDERRKTANHTSRITFHSIFRTPQVVTAHDMIPWVVPGYGGSPFFKLYLALATAGVKRATAIMADSDASRMDVIRILGVPPGRVHTVYLGVEPAPHYTETQLDEVRARYGLPRRYAFYLGGFDRRKNVPLLLRAWRDALLSLESTSNETLEERPLLAIGGAVPEPGGVFPDVHEEANSLGMAGLDAPVRFLGRISESDKPLLMAAAHLFVYPSSYEGFGLDPLEAMSVGCPVISSSGGSLIEVVGDGGLLVPPDDEPALCGAIVRAWYDPDLRAKLSHLGRLQASQFTWERTARQTLDVYTRALRRASRRQKAEGRRQ